MACYKSWIKSWILCHIFEEKISCKRIMHGEKNNSAHLRLTKNIMHEKIASPLKNLMVHP